MTQRRSFNKNYLQQEFDKLNAKTQPATLYLIGGGAMAFYGLKEATKDIDIILTNAEQLNSLLTALSKSGYDKPAQALITKSYCKMQTNAIMENTDGFRWDLFVNKVCNALMLSEAIKQRAKPALQRQPLDSSHSIKRGYLPLQRNNRTRGRPR